MQTTRNAIDSIEWQTARIIGHPDGVVWAAFAAERFDTTAGALNTIAAAEALLTGTLPTGGLIAEYLFCEALERAALAAEVEAIQIERDLLSY